MDLPVCFESAAESGEYDLFYSDAWDHFEANLIEPGNDLAVSVSTRLLNRFIWNKTWNTGGRGHTTLDRVEDISGCAEKWPGSMDQDWDVNWDGFKSTHPIRIPDEPQCDGFSEGAQVLNMYGDEARNPWFHENWHMHMITGGRSIPICM